MSLSVLLRVNIISIKHKLQAELMSEEERLKSNQCLVSQGQIFGHYPRKY